VRILHLSDCHVPRLSGIDADGVDARGTLAQLLNDCQHVKGIDLVVVSGDVADDGSREGYTDVLALIGRFARDRGVTQVYCTGNHDDRDAFAAVLGSGHVDEAGRQVGRLVPSALRERAAVSEVTGTRVITLDSLVPGQVYGLISQTQLAWLREVLAQPSPAGSVVVVHHPPITLDLELQKSVGLQNASALSEAIEGSDVQVVLCGHFHVQITGRLGSVPVWVGPGIVTRIDLTAPSWLERAVRGAAATVVDLDGPHSPMFHMLHARDPHAGQTVYLVDAVSGEDVDTE
jgi:3',5'-cyclic AMP phosphodiesterase CpdA